MLPYNMDAHRRKQSKIYQNRDSGMFTVNILPFRAPPCHVHHFYRSVHDFQHHHPTTPCTNTPSRVSSHRLVPNPSPPREPPLTESFTFKPSRTPDQTHTLIRSSFIVKKIPCFNFNLTNQSYGNISARNSPQTSSETIKNI